MDYRWEKKRTRAGRGITGAAVLVASTWAGGCSQSPSTVSDPPVPVAEQSAAPKASASADVAGSVPSHGQSETEAEVSGFRFRVPAGWRRAELTPAQQGFVDARFEIPDFGDDVKLTLSTISGGVEANLDRWIGQFQINAGDVPDREQIEVAGVPVTLIDIRGEFQGMGQSPQAGWRMLGAAFDGAPRDFYIKLTGPADAVDRLRDQFRAFVTSARRNGA